MGNWKQSDLEDARERIASLSNTQRVSSARLISEHINHITERPKIYSYTIGFKIPSLNEYYSGKHWSVRKKKADSIKSKICGLIKENMPHHINTFDIEITYNNRMDVDNVILSKFFVDSLRKLKIIPQDNTKHYKGLSIRFDDTIRKNTYLIKLNILSY